MSNGRPVGVASRSSDAQHGLRAEAFPKWLRELDRFLPLKSAVFLHGNIHDGFLYPTNLLEVAQARLSGAAVPPLDFDREPDLRSFLARHLRGERYDLVLFWDPLDGFSLLSSDPDVTLDNLVARLKQHRASEEQRVREESGEVDELPPDPLRSFAASASLTEPATALDALAVFRAVAGCGAWTSACVLLHGSRLLADPARLSEEEHRLFLQLLKAGQGAVKRSFPRRRNVVVACFDRYEDVPPWVLINNPVTRAIEVARPDREERRRVFAPSLVDFHGSGAELTDEQRQKTESRFADLTEGMSSNDIQNLASISRQASIAPSKMDAIVDLYRYGERENFWEKLRDDRVRGAGDELRKRVKGQDHAIARVTQVIRRAKLGLASVDAGRTTRPKGVLFFAGPTGTGKTEMAKAMAELIFNDDTAIIRFDMSEYSEPNSDVKLIGSAPGYVGYEAGGQLTRQVRTRPFSILLFDEIEKAHPKTFDKFLQILDDGRLTDGKGETVYFGEAIIVFTSNLGIFTEDPERGRVMNKEIQPHLGVAHNEAVILREVRSFFVNTLKRPEILNRFGDNFVVFDFIHRSSAREIIELRISDVVANLREDKGWSIRFADGFAEWFLENFLDDLYDFGGRGIRNRVETHVKNGLSDALFDRPELLAALDDRDHPGTLVIGMSAAGAPARVTFELAP